MIEDGRPERRWGRTGACFHSFHRAYYRIYLDIYTWGAHFPLLPQGKSRGART